MDRYEDWRLSPEERSQDLLAQMTSEQKAGMMLIADMRMYNEAFMLESSGETEPITSVFNEQDFVVDIYSLVFVKSLKNNLIRVY